MNRFSRYRIVAVAAVAAAAVTGISQFAAAAQPASSGTYTNGIWRLTAPARPGWPVLLEYPAPGPVPPGQQWAQIIRNGQLASATGLCATASGQAITGQLCGKTTGQRWTYRSGRIRQGSRCMTLGPHGEFWLRRCGLPGQIWMFTPAKL